jgi:hypothetical protein
MEMVIALIMYLNSEMVEHTYKESLSKCFDRDIHGTEKNIKD